MGQECSGWKGSQSEHNCVTDTKKSAKTGQNWPKIAQTMAIFHHKWLILWRKKIIFINIQLPMGSGQHLIPFGYLEVPLPPACSLVWRALWNRPAPLKKSYHVQILSKYLHLRWANGELWARLRLMVAVRQLWRRRRPMKSSSISTASKVYFYCF